VNTINVLIHGDPTTKERAPVDRIACALSEENCRVALEIQLPSRSSPEIENTRKFK